MLWWLLLGVTGRQWISHFLFIYIKGVVHVTRGLGSLNMSRICIQWLVLLIANKPLISDLALKILMGGWWIIKVMRFSWCKAYGMHITSPTRYNTKLYASFSKQVLQVMPNKSCKLCHTNPLSYAKQVMQVMPNKYCKLYHTSYDRQVLKIVPKIHANYTT